MAFLGRHYLARARGIWPVHYLSIDMDTVRDQESWWVVLTPDMDQATKWTVEQTKDGYLKIWCEMAGHTKAFLTAHGKSRNGHTPAVGHECFAALVHFKDDDNSLWHMQTMDVEGSRILRKAKNTNEGFALTGICFPGLLRQSGDSGPWRPLPYNNVVVRETKTETGDQHVLWSFLAVHDQDDLDMGAVED